MNKSQKTTAVVQVVNSPDVRGIEFTEADRDAALSLGVVLGGGVEDRLQRAVQNFNAAARLFIDAGYLLLSVKADCEHGQFDARLEQMGMSSQRASEFMRMAKFATALPAQSRAEMLSLPKSKVLAIANADPEVIEELLEQGEDFNDLSVRDLRRRIRELEAKVTDTTSERDAALAERDGLSKQLRRRRAAQAEGEDGVPMVVADLRAETAALVKQAELALTSLHPLGVEMVNLATLDDGVAWRQPTLRLAMSGLVALRVQLDGLIDSFANSLDDKITALSIRPAALSFLQEGEIAAIAKEWEELTAQHRHEQALRAHEREQAKPRGKGRPAAAPKAPKKGGA